MKIHFKNVGQGDSIILEWHHESEVLYGIVDCNLIDGKNPVLDFLKENQVFKIEFIILSHFHYDHFSGMAELFEYCMANKVVVRYFMHTLEPFLAEIYDRVFTSQKVQVAIKEFMDKFDALEVEDHFQVSMHTKKIELTGALSMSFLAPQGKTYKEMAQQLARKRNKITTTAADVNKLSTIILIENDKEECILLTADAVKKSFKLLKVTATAVLVQAPHHGSWPNVRPEFWSGLSRVENCPAVFSVGEVPRDRLPNVETIDFFHEQSYVVHSTNFVYGVAERFGGAERNPAIQEKSALLNSFSKLKAIKSTLSDDPRYSGNQIFEVLA